MRKKIIAIDMDDTICHLVQKSIHYHNARYPDHLLTMDKIVNFDLSGIWHPDCNDEIFFGRPGLYEELEVFDRYTAEEMQRIHLQHDLIIVTAARPASVQEKWNWLQKHMPFIPFENFFTGKRKHLINFDLLIDDGPHNLLAAADAGKKVICIPHPWNLDVQNRFVLKDSWKGMSELVNQMLEE